MPRANANLEISFKALTRILTPRDGDYVTLDSSGRLQVRSSRGEANQQNRRLVNHLLQLFIQRMDAQSAAMDGNAAENALTVTQKEALRHYFLHLMEMPENGDCPAVSMKQLRQAMDFVNMASSELLRVQRSNTASPAERRMAEKVADWLPASFMQQKKPSAGSFSEYQNRETEQLREMLNNGHRQGIPASDISEKQLRTVAGGRMFEVQNLVYRAIRNIYDSLCAFSRGAGYDVEQLLADDALLTGLFAYAIRHEAAVSPFGREAELSAMSRYMTERSFALADRKALLKSIEQSYVHDLMQEGSRGLAQEVDRRRDRKRAWRNKQATVNHGTQYLQSLADQMQRMFTMEKQAVCHGLSREQAAELRQCGAAIDAILGNAQHWADIELVARNMSTTRFASAVKELAALRKAGMRYAMLADNVARATERLPQPAPEEMNPGDAQPEELPEMQLQSFKELDFEEVTAADGMPSADSQSGSDTVDLLAGFTEAERTVASALLLETELSALIEKEDTKTVQQLEALYGLLRAFDEGAATAGQLTVKGVDVLLSLSDSGNVRFRIGRQDVPTIHSPAFLLQRMEEDICANIRKFGRERAAHILNVGLTQAQRGENSSLSRSMLCDILRQTTGVPARELSNIPTTELSAAAQLALQDRSRGNRKKLGQALLRGQNRAEAELNEQDTLEALRKLEALAVNGAEQLKDRVEYTPTEKKKANIKVRWTDEEAAVQRLLADMISPLETWQNDLRQRKTGADRLRYTLYRHSDTVAMLLQKPYILDGFSHKLGNDFAIPAADELKNLFGRNENIQQLLMDCYPAELSLIVRGLVGNRGDLRRAAETLTKCMKRLSPMTRFFAEGRLRQELGDEGKELETLTDVLERHLLRQREEIDFEKLDQDIEEAAHAQFDSLQEKMEAGVEKLFSKHEALSDDIRDLSLSDIMNENLAGNAGQARYMRKVLGGYFREADPASKREMLASAFRELIPEQPGGDEDELQAGSAMSGLFKGAGPLFQKTLQGLPSENMPPALRQALDDVKSRLRSIDPAVVTARMHQMVESSQGRISRISVERSLGAATVGEAFLCRVYGPTLEKEGREVVIKLLRPDVKNRMSREKDFFLRCAKETDAGMAKTIAGQLSVYEKELDLRLEARNIQRGAVYNKGEDTVKSEHLMTLVRPTTNSLMVEKANGTTVGDYFKHVRERLEALRDDESPAAVAELGKLYTDLQKRQEYLTTLAKKWINQGIFESGFYQADLHKDNIMIDDKQATVIDYGNATLLSTKQRREITKMVFAASMNTPKFFVEHYGKLLPDASQALFEKKKNEFENRTRIIFNKKGDPGTKIAVALCEAQKLGLELPSTVYNFSMGQVRLKNTLEEGNNLLRSLHKEFKKERKPSVKDPFYEIHRELGDEFDTSKSMGVYLKYLCPDNTRQPMTAAARRVEEYVQSGENVQFNTMLDKLFELEAKDNSHLLKEHRDAVLSVTDPGKKAAALFNFRNVLAVKLEEYDRIQYSSQAKAQSTVEDNPEYKGFFDIMNSVLADNIKRTKELLGFSTAMGYGILVTGRNAWKALWSWKKRDPNAAANEVREDLRTIYGLDAIMASTAQYLSERSGQLSAAEKEQRIRVIHNNFTHAGWNENTGDIGSCIDTLHISDGLKRRLKNELNVFTSREQVEKLFHENQGSDRLLRVFKLMQRIKKNMADSDLGQQVLADASPADGLWLKDAMIKKTLTMLEDAQKKEINRYANGFEILTADGLLEENVLTREAADALKAKEQAREQKRLQEAEARKQAEKDGFVIVSKEELLEAAAGKSTKKTAKKEEKQKIQKKTELPQGELEEDIPNGFFGNGNKKAESEADPEFYLNYQGFVWADEENYKKINSNDIEVLKGLKKDVMPNLNRHLEYRIRKLKEIQEAAEDNKARGPIGQPVISEDARNIVLPEVRMAENQDTGNGCWSVSLAMQLAYRGVHLDQRTIRAHKPDTWGFSQNDLADANADQPNAIPLYADLVQKVLPNTAMKSVEVTETSRAEAKAVLEACLQKALRRDNSPVSFLCGMHYRTIYGIENGNVLMYDSLPSREDKVSIPLETLLDECKTTSHGEEKYVYKLQWLQDLKLNAHGEPELPDFLRQRNVGYLGGSLTDEEGDNYTSQYFKGYETEKVGSNTDVVTILPNELKTKAIDGFYPEALREICDKAKAADASPDTLALLEAYPQKRPVGWFFGNEGNMLKSMLPWAEKLQQAYGKSDAVSQGYIREALAEVKNSLILQEKLKLKTEIRKNLRDEQSKIYYAPDKDGLFRDAMARALWIAKFEVMDAQDPAWLQQANLGLQEERDSGLAAEKQDLEELKSDAQYGTIFRDLCDLSNVVLAQLQPEQGYKKWTVQYRAEIPYVREMRKLAGDLCRGGSLADSLHGLTAECAQRQKERAKAEKAAAEKAEFEQAKDSICGEKTANMPEGRKSIGGAGRISREELARKLKAEGEKAPEIKRTLSFTSASTVKNKRMQKK